VIKSANADFPGYEILDSCPLLDWIIEHSREFGASIEIVSSSTGVAKQFVDGFGGVGGILRYQAEPLEEVAENGEGSEYDYEY